MAVNVDLPLFIVDAFTKVPFRGNSAGVCLIPFDQDVPSSVMQKIATEMNLSETAFIKINEGDTFQNGNQFHLRWFTPICEVPLCGHATLASSAVLFSEHIGNKSDVIMFNTLSGTLKAKKLPNNKIELDLPAYQTNPVTEKYGNIVKAIAGNLPVVDVRLSSSKKLLIRLEDRVTRKELESRQVSQSELMSHETDIVGVILTVKASEDGMDDEGCQYDFLSRYFAPWFGILEDPVTGSAHSVLAPYWSKILNKKTFYACQCSRRRGELHVELLEDRVILHGNAVIVVRGQIRI